MAASAEMETAGNPDYQDRHLDAIFQEGFSFSGYERDMLSLNLGKGKYLNISGVSGADSISDGRGSIFADFDNDGDLDIFLTSVQGEAHFLFRNNIGQRNAFIRVQLDGRESGSDAYGSVVRVKTSTGLLTKIKAGGSGFLSQNDPRLLFGLGKDQEAEWVEVTWPTGRTQRFEHVAAGSAIRIVEGDPPLEQIAETRFSLVDPLSRGDAILARTGFRKGEPFPDLLLRDLDQGESRLRDLIRPDRTTLVNLWATYCLPCQAEMPVLQSMTTEFHKAGIDLVGVSIDVATADRVSGFLEEYGITYPIYMMDENSVSDLFERGEVMIPISFLLDGDGRIMDVLAGWSGDSREELKRLTSLAGH